MTLRRCAVIGIGNPLMQDEGIAIRVIGELMARYDFPADVALMDAGTLGMGMLGLFRDHDYLLVIDAVDGTGHPAGTIFRMAPDDLAPTQVMHSAHDIRLPDVLRAASLIGADPEVDCVGIQVAEMDRMEMGLTADVEAAVEPAIHVVLGVLAEHDIVPVVRAQRGPDSIIMDAMRTHPKKDIL